MVVKSNDKQISFLFQEADPFLEIGCTILKQEHIEQMLPYKRKHQNGSEKIIFDIQSENIVLLSDVLSDLNESDIVDLLYEIIFLNKKVEENGFLKRNCIWYKYDNVYYDRDRNCIMTAILPIADEIKYEDDISWYGHFEDTIKSIIKYLSERKSQYMIKLLNMYEVGKITDDFMLEEIDRLGCRVSGMLSEQLTFDREVTLKLLYSGKNGRIEYEVGNEDFLVGRNEKEAAGFISTEFSNAVSRKHCLITKINNKYFVQDLKSVNRTLVNGIMIPPYELMELQHNDILSVADVEFRVLMQVSDCRSVWDNI